MSWSVALPNISAMEIHTIRRFLCESMDVFGRVSSLDADRQEEMSAGSTTGVGAGGNFDGLMASAAGSSARPVQRFRNT